MDPAGNRDVPATLCWRTSARTTRGTSMAAKILTPTQKRRSNGSVTTITSSNSTQEHPRGPRAGADSHYVGGRVVLVAMAHRGQHLTLADTPAARGRMHATGNRSPPTRAGAGGRMWWSGAFCFHYRNVTVRRSVRLTPSNLALPTPPACCWTRSVDLERPCRLGCAPVRRSR
jgi:hypothetical protein